MKDVPAASKLKNVTIAQVEAELAQTQCGECGYDGCAPYAKAIVEQGAAINLCRPGGERVIKNLANLLNQPMCAPAKPQEHPLTAFIDASKCIGCTLCVQACPTDCISGSNKEVHTVNDANCTGCRLCVEPCPVDCITIVPNPVFQFLHRYSTSEKEQWEKIRADEVLRLVQLNEEKISTGQKRRLTRHKTRKKISTPQPDMLHTTLHDQIGSDVMEKIDLARQQARSRSELLQNKKGARRKTTPTV